MGRGPLRSLAYLIVLIAFVPDRTWAQSSPWHVWQDTTQADTARAEALADLIQQLLHTDPDSAVELAEALHYFARMTRSPLYEGVALRNIGNAHHQQGADREALSHYIRALEIHRKAGLIGQASADLGDLATSLAAIGQLERARSLQVHSLRLLELTGDSTDLATAHNNVGQVLLLQGDLAGATGYFLCAIDIDERNGQKEGVMLGHANLGAVMAQQEEFSAAIDHTQKALILAEELGHERIKAGTLSNLGSFAAESGDLRAAIRYHDEAFARYEALNDQAGMAATSYNLGDVLGKQGDHKAARTYMQRSAAIAERVGDRYHAALATGGLAAASLELGDPHKAIELGEQARFMLEAMGFAVETGTVANVLYKAYAQVREPAKALAMHELFISLRDSAQSEEVQRDVLRQEYDFANMKRAFTDSLLHASAMDVQLREMRKQKVVRNGFVGGFALVALFATILFIQRNRIGREKARSEELLLNILPEEVANELKEKGSSDARLIDEATILFTDFKEFTSISEQLNARELVEELDICFKAFDMIIAQRGIEKIKTIGDAYMCAAGIPEPGRSSPVQVIQAALQMQAFMVARAQQRRASGKPAFDMRLGIHTGPVVAGIVGLKKFQYDIWGDTVNIAARMESSGEVGRVNLSEAAYERVKDTLGLRFISRGRVQAKGKGELDMWFVEHR